MMNRQLLNGITAAALLYAMSGCMFAGQSTKKVTASAGTSASPAHVSEVVSWMKWKFRQHSFRRMYVKPPDYYNPSESLLRAVAYYTTPPLNFDVGDCVMTFSIDEYVGTTSSAGASVVFTRSSFRIPLASLDPGQVELEDIEDSVQRMTLYTTNSTPGIKRDTASQSGALLKTEDLSFVIITVPSASALGERLLLGFESLIKECGGKENRELFWADEENK